MHIGMIQALNFNAIKSFNAINVLNKVRKSCTIGMVTVQIINIEKNSDYLSHFEMQMNQATLTAQRVESSTRLTHLNLQNFRVVRQSRIC